MVAEEEEADADAGRAECNSRGDKSTCCDIGVHITYSVDEISEMLPKGQQATPVFFLLRNKWTETALGFGDGGVEKRQLPMTPASRSCVPPPPAPLLLPAPPTNTATTTNTSINTTTTIAAAATYIFHHHTTTPTT